jgi:hypothetical protein
VYLVETKIDVMAAKFAVDWTIAEEEKVCGQFHAISSQQGARAMEDSWQSDHAHGDHSSFALGPRQARAILVDTLVSRALLKLLSNGVNEGSRGMSERDVRAKSRPNSSISQA